MTAICFGLAPSAIHSDTAVWRRSWIRNGARPAASTAGVQNRLRKSVARIGRPSGDSNTRRSAAMLAVAKRASSSTTKRGKRYGSHGRLGLRRAEGDVAADVHEGLGDVHAASQQIDAAPAQPQHLAQSEAAESTEQHEGPIAGVDRLGEPHQLVGAHEAHLTALDTRQRQLGDRVVRDQPVLERGFDALVQQLHDAVDRGGREARAVRGAELGDPGAQGSAVQLADRSAAKGRKGMSAEVLRIPCLCARPQVGHRRPPSIPPLGDRDAAQPRVDERALEPVHLHQADVRLGIPRGSRLTRTTRTSPATSWRAGLVRCQDGQRCSGRREIFPSSSISQPSRRN